MTDTLVVGRGMLGRALGRARPGAHYADRPVRWGDEQRAVEDLIGVVTTFVEATSAPRALAWCAGGGYVGADADAMLAEARLLGTVLRTASSLDGGWTAFVASSAGGVYGHGRPECLDELDVPVPASPYGTAKVAVEEAARAWAGEHGATMLVGRIANLYGPTQRLDKAQGLITHLCRAAITRRPLSLFVSAETQRDYIYVDDAAAVIARWMDVAASQPGVTETKVIATGRATSIAGVLTTVTRVTRVRPPVVFSVDARTALQPRFVRLRSTWRTELDRFCPARPLEAGVCSVWHQFLRTRV